MMKWYVKLILPSIWLHYQVEWNKRKQSSQLWPWLIPSCLLSFVGCNRTTDPFNTSTTPPPCHHLPTHAACMHFPHLFKRDMGDDWGRVRLNDLPCWSVVTAVCPHNKNLQGQLWAMHWNELQKKLVFRCRPLIPKLTGYTWVIIHHE